MIKKSPHYVDKEISNDKYTSDEQHFAFCISAIKEHATFEQAVKDPPWVEAMQKEVSALEENKTWISSDLPPDKTLVDCKWV